MHLQLQKPNLITGTIKSLTKLKSVQKLCSTVRYAVRSASYKTCQTGLYALSVKAVKARITGFLHV